MVGFLILVLVLEIGKLRPNVPRVICTKKQRARARIARPVFKLIYFEAMTQFQRKRRYILAALDA